MNTNHGMNEVHWSQLAGWAPLSNNEADALHALPDRAAWADCEALLARLRGREEQAVEA